VNKEIEIKAKVKDSGDGVKEVTLHYRKVGNTQYKPLTLTKDGDTYKGTIPASDVYIEGIEYYIRATDGNNSATDPADQNKPHLINVKEKKDDDDDKGFLPGFELMFIIAALGAVGFFRRKRK